MNHSLSPIHLKLDVDKRNSYYFTLPSLTASCQVLGCNHKKNDYCTVPGTDQFLQPRELDGSPRLSFPYLQKRDFMASPYSQPQGETADVKVFGDPYHKAGGLGSLLCEGSQTISPTLGSQGLAGVRGEWEICWSTKHWIHIELGRLGFK